jgi:transposase
VLMSFGRHRDKVSTITAIAVTPRGRRIRLFWRTNAEHYIDAAGVVAFLRGVLDQVRGRVIVVWDGGSNHKGPLMRELLARRKRLHLERLPAYAPDLNPVEMIWSYLKYGLMANFVPRDVHEVDEVVQGHLRKLDKDPKLIRALWAGSRLPPV